MLKEFNYHDSIGFRVTACLYTYIGTYVVIEFVVLPLGGRGSSDIRTPRLNVARFPQSPSTHEKVEIFLMGTSWPLSEVGVVYDHAASARDWL